MASDSTHPTPEVGMLLAGKLRLDRVLGEGAMGIVFEAHDTVLSRRVAVKVILPEMVSNSRQRIRFHREARAAAALSSEHAVRVLDVSGEDEEPYLVMEYLEGRTLESISRAGPVPPHAAVDWMIQALAALAEAHALGLVHRDIKPANLFLADRMGREPIVKVLDFGVVKDLDPTKTRLTKTGAAMGSPAYMAPEQVRAMPDIDARADVWSVGVTLYELLTATLPFSATTLPDLLMAICQSTPVPLREGRPEIPEALERVVMRCLAKDPYGRYKSAAEISEALSGVMTGPAATAVLEPRRVGQSPMTMPMPSPIRLAATVDWTSAAPPAPARAPAPAPAHAPPYFPPPYSSRRNGAPRPRPQPRALIFVVALLAVVVLGALALVALYVLTLKR